MRKTGIISAMWVEAEKLHMAMEQDTVKEYEYNGMKFYEGRMRRGAFHLRSRQNQRGNLHAAYD